MPARPYDADFYAAQREQSLKSARHVLPLVFELVPAQSVVDVGCGVGTWLAAAREKGVADVFGLDGDYVSRQDLLIDAGSFRAHDLSTPFELGRRFDLAMSLEVAEHLPGSAARQFVEQLTRLSDVVLFSAAIPYQGGVNHVNEQWPDYWEDLFRACGYEAVDCLRDRIWNNPDVETWYSQNTILYVKAERLARDAALRTAAAGSIRPTRRLVHPGVFLRYSSPASWGVRRALHQLRVSVRTAVRRKLGRAG